MIGAGHMRWSGSLRVGSAVALVAALAARAAHADDPSREAMAAAEATFDEGKRLVAKGRLEEGCAKLEESQRLAPASGTLLNLGDCYEKLGRTASAWATFRASAAAAQAKGRRARDEEARARAAALEPRLSKLRIVVPEAARLAGLEIRRADLAVGETLWGTPVPVDPGKHAIVATAPAHARWSTSVDVPAGPGVVDVTVPRLDDAPDAAPAPKPAPPAPGIGTQRIVGLVLGGVGAVALGFGIGFGVDAIRKKDDSNAPGGCAANLCPPDALELRDDAVVEANVSTALFVGAGVALAAGALLWITAPEGTRVGVGALPRAAGAVVGATF